MPQTDHSEGSARGERAGSVFLSHPRTEALVKSRPSSLLVIQRSRPPPDVPPGCRGLWEMRPPCDQPGRAKKRSALHFASVSVRERADGGEPHGPDHSAFLGRHRQVARREPQESGRRQVSIAPLRL